MNHRSSLNNSPLKKKKKNYIISLYNLGSQVIDPFSYLMQSDKFGVKCRIKAVKKSNSSKVDSVDTKVYIDGLQ